MAAHVVVGLIRKSEGGKEKYLLMSSKSDFGKFTGFYYPPGGHFEEGENESGALKREIVEELGVACVPVREIAQSPGDVPDQITHWWECECESLDFTFQEEEVADVRWFTREEVLACDKIWPATKKFFEEKVS